MDHFGSVSQDHPLAAPACDAAHLPEKEVLTRIITDNI